MLDVLFASQDTILQLMSLTVVMSFMDVWLVLIIVIFVRLTQLSRLLFVIPVNMDMCYWVQVHVMLVDQRRRQVVVSNVIRTRHARFVLVD